jgi:hypothetical protein
MTDTRDASLGEAVSLIDRAGEQAPKLLEKSSRPPSRAPSSASRSTPAATPSSRLRR